MLTLEQVIRGAPRHARVEAILRRFDQQQKSQRISEELRIATMCFELERLVEREIREERP